MKSIIGWKDCIWLGVLTAAIGLVQYQPAAAQGITADEFKHSLWDTTYTTASGGRVRATVVLDGASGYYDIPGARGRLSNVQYFIDTAGGGGSSRNWAALITGNWSLGSSRGSFSFQSDSSGSPIRFNGNWKFTNGSGNSTWITTTRSCHRDSRSV
jgi:hypothetical protein